MHRNLIQGILFFFQLSQKRLMITGVDNTPHPGYVDMIEELTTKFPVEEACIEGETNQKAFISLFGAIPRMRNLLSSFDEFAGKEILSDRDMQD